MRTQYRKSFKTKLDPTVAQRIMFAKCAGTARHAYNWGLAEVLESMEKNERIPSAMDLHKRLVAEVKKENPWYYNSSSCPPQQALRNLGAAVDRFYKKTSERPKFKKKNQNDSFYLQGSIKTDGKKIKLPTIGWVKCFEKFPSIPKNVTISKQAGNWYISYSYDFTPEQQEIKSNIVGVDIGITNLAMCSDGTQFENPKAYKKNINKLTKLQRSLAKKQKGSKNREKVKWKLQKQHKKISDIRNDSLHKLTTWLAKNHGVIGIECLNVSGMLRNHKLAQSIADCGFGTFRNFLSYKCEWYGSTLVDADTFFPSSKLCSSCGEKKDTLLLSERTYHCHECGLVIDRDLNAAINLQNYAVKQSQNKLGMDRSEVTLQEMRQ